MLLSDFDDALLRQISRRGGGDGVVRVTELNVSLSFSTCAGAAAGVGACLLLRGVAGSPVRGADPLASLVGGGGGGKGSFIIISFSRAEGSS